MIPASDWWRAAGEIMAILYLVLVKGANECTG